MVVAILLSYLNRIGQRRHFRDVFIGVAAAMVVAGVGGVAAYEFVRHYNGSSVQTYFETATYLIATGALTYMTFWMQRHARSLTGELERRGDVALSGGTRTGLRLLAFQAVGREGLETMVFTLAIVFASSPRAATPVHGTFLLVGAALGLALALAVAVAIYRLGAKVNLRRFFRILGVTLMVVAAGLLADAVENLQQLGWLPVGRAVMWDTSRVVAQASNTGDALHSLVGYADRPTVLQGIVWVAYVALATAAFVAHGRQRRRRRAPATTASGALRREESEARRSVR